MAKPRSQPKQQSRNSAIILVLLILGLSIVAGLLFQDSRGVKYGWFVGLMWLVAAVFSCAFGIIYYAQFVLPHHKEESWLEGIAMMLRAATQFSPPASPMQRSGQESAADAERISPSFQTLQAGMVRSNQALAVGKGDRLLRAVGPGFVRLPAGERPVQAIDLRRHARNTTAIAYTRDGIPLETKVHVVFQVKQSEQDHPDDHLEYPYDRSAVLWVSQLNTFDQDDTVRQWDEQLVPQAVTLMVSEIAQFTLDELWQDPAIFKGIQQRIRRQLRSIFDEWGIKVDSVKVTPLELPEEIAAQRVASWRAPWQSQIQAQKAAANAESLRRVKLARARAQIEIIEKVMQQLAEKRATEEASLADIVTISAVDVLEDAAAKSPNQNLLPSRVLASIAQESSSRLQSAHEYPANEDEESVS